MAGMSFDQNEFLNRHIPQRLGNLDLFYHSLRIILSQPTPKEVRVSFDHGHELRGPYWVFTNLAIETGIIKCRELLQFLEAKKSKYEGDVLITMFQHPSGKNLDPVPLSEVATCHPPTFSDTETLEALKFTKLAADKAVAHLTLGPPQPKGDEIELYQLAYLAIREAIAHHLYEKLGLAAPARIVEDFKRGELD
jgi:hypothetical protein